MLLAQITAPYLMLFIATAVGAISVPIYNVNQVTYRQALIDVRLQGRVNATIRTFVWGTTLLGSRTILFGSLVAGLRRAVADPVPQTALGRGRMCAALADQLLGPSRPAISQERVPAGAGVSVVVVMPAVN